MLQLMTIDDSKPEKGNGGKSCREKCAIAYSAEEHVALLQLLLEQPDSFNCSENSSECRKVHGDLCKNCYSIS